MEAATQPPGRDRRSPLCPGPGRHSRAAGWTLRTQWVCLLTSSWFCADPKGQAAAPTAQEGPALHMAPRVWHGHRHTGFCTPWGGPAPCALPQAHGHSISPCVGPSSPGAAPAVPPGCRTGLDAALTASICSKNRTGSPDLLTRGGGPSSIKPLVSTSCMPGTERGTQCGKQQAHGHPGWSGLRHQRVSCRGIHTV